MSKKFGVVYLVVLSFFISICLGVIVPSVNGAMVTIESFGVIFIISFVLTILLGLILPLPKIGAKFCEYLHQDPHTGLGKVFTSIVTGTLLMVFITFVMIGVLTGFGEVEGTNYLSRYASGLVQIQPIIVVLTLLLDPPATALTKRLVKEKKPSGISDKVEV